MKKLLALSLALALLVSCAPFALADGQTGSVRLSGLTHNCPNTGKMLPTGFDPYTTTYLLTVASWVSRVKFTPQCADATATITVNGQYVQSGHESQIIQMTDDPQAVTIICRAQDGTQTIYTVYLQRRPSERRTRSSAGYINSVYTDSKGVWHIAADLVTLKYTNGTNLSSFYNDSSYLYKYACPDNCIFYYGGNISTAK